MPKVIINPLKGLYQTGGTGVVVESAGLEGLAYGNTKSAIGSGAHNVDWSITQPAGTVLTDVGVVTTTATVGASNIVISVGTSAGDQTYSANATFVSSNVAAIGSSIQVSSASQGQGNASMSFVDAAALYTAADRTIYIRAAASATQTAGELASYIKYTKLA